MNAKTQGSCAALGLAAALTLAAACSESQAEAAGSGARWQADLLDLAFEAASAAPIDPHIKNRSRMQAEVVAAALELDRHGQALGFVERIDNWQRGQGYADLAQHLAERGGERDEIDRLLGLAREQSRLAQALDEQGWRIDRIDAGVARTLVWLGEDGEAAAIEAGLGESELGPVACARAARIDEAELDGVLAELAGTLASGNFEQLNNALDACTALYERFYAQTDARAAVEQTIETALAKLPIPLHVESAMERAEIALGHSDAAGALVLTLRAQALLDEYTWPPDAGLPLEAELAELRFRAGDEEQAREQVDLVLAAFGEERERIADYDRSDVLVPIAEALRTMGADAEALAVYARALEEGCANPNARARCEDLVATCCSLALGEVEPDDAIWERARAARAGLRDPW